MGMLAVIMVMACTLVAYSPTCSSVTTCSGYISLAPALHRLSSNQPLDLSEIRLILNTKSGLRKETVQCAPNGFFIVPIYEMGTFILEARHPQNWTLSPPSYQFNIAEDSQGTDELNFRVQGFPVHGSVIVPILDTCSDQRTPVSDVVIVARSSSSASPTPISTRADADGRFTLSGLTPGKYLITAQHDRRRLQPDSVMHTVTWGESHSQPFRMTGATVSGVILALPANIAMGLYLIPRGSTAPSSCIGRDSSCYSRVSEKGTFMFADVPCGLYDLFVDLMDSTSARYVFNINTVEVQIGFDDLVIAPDTFSIVGVTVVVEVKDHVTSAPIDSARVYVDNVEIGMSDPQGRVIWNANNLNQNHGPYTFRAEKAGVHFAKTRPFYLGDGTGPVLQADKYDICGFVQVPESASASDFEVEVMTGSSVISKVSLNADGTYCYAAVPGHYVLRPVSRFGPLSPATREVILVHEPVTNVGFYQLTVSVHGFVSCFQKSDCENVVVSIDKIGSTISASNITEPGGFLHFSDLAPGQYRISASKGNMCFDSVQVELGQHDLSNVAIQQKGVEVVVRSPLPAPVELVDTASNRIVPVSIPAEKPFTLCVPSDVPSQFQLRSGSGSSVRFVGEPVPLSQSVALVPEQIEIVGEVHVPIKLVSALELQAISELETVTMTANIVSESDSIATLQYRFWGQISQTYTITVTSSADLVFDPTHVKVSVHASVDVVPLSADPIRGRAGLFRTGKITPAVPGARAIARPSNSDSVLSMIITEDEYRFGPLSDAADYLISIEHENFKFEPVGNGDFRAVRLRSLEIYLVDHFTGQPIEGVLVSLSGPSYRNNSLTAVDGLVTFSGLDPGKYFLFLVLKEYVFDPPSQTIDLPVADDGDTLIRYKVIGRRTRYSVFGSVQSIAKNGVGSVVVSASSADGELVEETVSDAAGRYRIRGLSAGTPYRISLRTSDSDTAERSVPEVHVITMPSEDVRDIDFICYRRPQHGQLFGTLPSGKMPTLVELRHSESGRLERVVPCSPAKRFFSISNIPFGSYLLTAESQDIALEPISVDIFGSVKVAFESKAMPKAEDFENTPKTSIFTIVVGFMLVFAVINYEKLQVKAKKWNKRRLSRNVSVEQSWNIATDKKGKNSPIQKSRQ